MNQAARKTRHLLPLLAGVVVGLTITTITVVGASALLPNLSLTSVTGGLVVSGVVPLTAQADAAGFSSLQFEVSGQPVGPAITAGACSTAWDTRTVANGVHTVTAVARDSAGNPVTAAPVLVTVLNGASDSAAPTVALTSPSQGATISGAVAVVANVSDNIGVTGVWFSLDGATVSAEMAPNQGAATWTFASTGTSNGAHVLRAMARDAAGNVGNSAAITVTVSNSGSTDTTLPVVNLTAPAAGATVSGTVTVSANASDNVGVASVQFTLDGVNLGAPDTSAPFAFSWNTTGAINGTHVLKAFARDAAGNVEDSSAVSVTVSNAPQNATPPTVSVTGPANGTTVSGTVTVTGSASQASGIASVQFSVDGIAIGTDTTAPYSATWNTAATSNGTHALRAVALDNLGNSSTSGTVVVTVNNVTSDTTLPTVSLTGPSSFSVVRDTVTISASASDNVSIARVQFTVDGVEVGSDTTAPYAISWNSRTVGNGSHAIRATAQDTAGNTRTTTARTISVGNANLDTTAPSVSVAVSPMNATTSGNITLTATANDNIGIVGVQFLIDGGAAGAEDTSAPYQITWNTSTLPNGPHWVSARARDAAGNQQSATIAIQVNNTGSGVVADFNNDGKRDLLFRHTNGQLYSWFMDGGSLVGQSALSPDTVNPVWRVVGTDDFNGDRKADLLWQHQTSGDVHVWYLDGTTLIGEASVYGPTPWRIAVTGDFNGDGRADVIWRHPTQGLLYVWFMGGIARLSESPLNPAQYDPIWRIVGAADFTEDGKADLIWQHSTTGALAYWSIDGASVTESGPLNPGAVDVAWQIRSVGDFDRDRSPDLVFQHVTTGELYIWYMRDWRLARQGFLSPSRVDTAWQVIGGN